MLGENFNLQTISDKEPFHNFTNLFLSEVFKGGHLYSRSKTLLKFTFGVLGGVIFRNIEQT